MANRGSQDGIVGEVILESLGHRPTASPSLGCSLLLERTRAGKWLLRRTSRAGPQPNTRDRQTLTLYINQRLNSNILILSLVVNVKSNVYFILIGRYVAFCATCCSARRRYSPKSKGG